MMMKKKKKKKAQKRQKNKSKNKNATKNNKQEKIKISKKKLHANLMHKTIKKIYNTATNLGHASLNNLRNFNFNLFSHAKCLVY